MSSHETRSKFNKHCKVKRIQVNPGKSSYYSSLNLKTVSTKFHKCSVCNKEFRRSVYFRHLLIHSQQKPFKCKHCSAAFRRSDNCRNHENRIHKYSCGQNNSCNAAFISKRMLTRHRRAEHKSEGKIVRSNNNNKQKFTEDINLSHTAQASSSSSLNFSTYKCNFCDNHFLTRQDQEAHQNSHDDDETEPETEEEDSNNSDIDVAGQKQPKFHDCQLCERAFLSEEALLSHVQSRHSINNNNNSKLNSNMVLKTATVRIVKIKSDENKSHNEFKTEAVRNSLPASLRRSSPPPTVPGAGISSNERKRGHAANLFLRRRNSKSEENRGDTSISSSKTTCDTDIYEFKDDDSDDGSIYRTYNLRKKERVNYFDDLNHSEGSNKEQKLSKSRKENQELPTTDDTNENKAEFIKLIKKEKEVPSGTVNSNFESRLTRTTTTTKRIKVVTKTKKLKKKLPRHVIKSKNKINTALPASKICPFCKRQFKDGFKLKVHIRVHTGEKPHACQFPNCGKAFSQKHSLIEHIRAHTGERPYSCNLCQASFALLRTLKCHKMSMRHSTHPPVYKIPRLQQGRALNYFKVEKTNSSRDSNISSINDIENRGQNNITKTEPEPDSDSGRQLKMKPLNSKLSLPNTLKVELEKVLVPQTISQRETPETHHASITVDTNTETKVSPEIIKEAQRNYHQAVSNPKARRHTIIRSQFQSQPHSLQNPKLQTESHNNNSFKNGKSISQEGPTKIELGRTILGISKPVVSNSKLYVAAPKCPKSKLSKSFQSLKSSAGLTPFPKSSTSNLPECIRQNLNYNILEYICTICSSKFAYRVDAVEHARRTHAVHC